MLGRKRRDWDGVDRREPALVLVVGDDGDSNELLSRVLVSAGFRTAKAADEASAKAKLADLLPRCVVIDLGRAGIGSSLKILEGIRSHDDRRVAQARVVLIARSKANRVYSIQSGVDAFLTRPFHVNELLSAVNDTIDRPQSERAAHRAKMLTDAEAEAEAGSAASPPEGADVN